MLKIFFRKFRPTKHQVVTMSFRAEVPVCEVPRMFRREQHCKPFIFKESELSEGLKAVLFEMRYRASGGSLVTHRDKLIELPAETLRRVKQIVY